ncbi:Csu type fimbrial protein [Neisseria sp. Ec49-e6-T10]|uniref:Csu type fimbrial protein n=1 Tax=Neisseria sp. Ec49-e6-T10 TaxID=3140744 RepID=UPI003EBC6AD7
MGYVSKKVRYFTITLPFFFLFNSFVLADTQNASFDVNATLIASCEAGTTTGGATSFGTLNFGDQIFLKQDIKVIGTQNAGAIRIKCNNNTNYKIVMGNGNSGNAQQRFMKRNNATDRIYYNLYTDSNYTTIWDSTVGLSQIATGQEQWIPVYGMVYAQTTVYSGIYTDVIPVTISW